MGNNGGGVRNTIDTRDGQTCLKDRTWEHYKALEKGTALNLGPHCKREQILDDIRILCRSRIKSACEILKPFTLQRQVNRVAVTGPRHCAGRKWPLGIIFPQPREIKKKHRKRKVEKKNGKGRELRKKKSCFPVFLTVFLYLPVFFAELHFFFRVMRVQIKEKTN